MKGRERKFFERKKPDDARRWKSRFRWLRRRPLLFAAFPCFIRHHAPFDRELAVSVSRRGRRNEERRGAREGGRVRIHRLMRWTLPEESARGGGINQAIEPKTRRHRDKGFKTHPNSPQSLRGPCESHTGGEEEGLADAATAAKERRRAVTSKRATIAVVVFAISLAALGGG